MCGPPVIQFAEQTSVRDMYMIPQELKGKVVEEGKLGIASRNIPHQSGQTNSITNSLTGSHSKRVEGSSPSVGVEQPRRGDSALFKAELLPKDLEGGEIDKMVAPHINKMPAKSPEVGISPLIAAVDIGYTSQTHFAYPRALHCYRCPLFYGVICWANLPKSIQHPSP